MLFSYILKYLMEVGYYHHKIDFPDLNDINEF